jgi:transposase InsO family protein
MELKSRKAYMDAIYERYHKVPKQSKTRILNEVCEVCGYHRKYAIWRISQWRAREGQPASRKRRRRGKLYPPEVLRIVEKVWEVAGYPWSVRLKEILRLWLPWIRRQFRLAEAQESKLLVISPSTIDRTLRDQKRQLRCRIYGRTKPGTLLRHRIEIRCEHWDVKVPGYLELDLVSHSGSCAEGEFIYTLNLTDMASTWDESCSVMGKSEEVVIEALREIAAALPFPVLGIHSDNGSEFINWHLKAFCDARDLQFTRSRPYKKDDNAHIEQKNWTHVRKLIGWDRYDSPQALQAMNGLFRHELRWYMNLFQPSVKLVQAIYKGSRRTRHYDHPQTPLDRLLSLKAGDPQRLEELSLLRRHTDPFELAAQVQEKLEIIWSLRHFLPRSSEIKAAEEKLKATEEKALQAIAKIFGANVYVRTRPGGPLVRIPHG